MPKTLSTSDPNLQSGVRRLTRVLQAWGVLLLLLGLLTELAATSQHPVSGLPFIALGLFALRWHEPALLAGVATLIAFSLVPTINPQLTVLGPDPLRQIADLSVIELVALVAGKVLVVLTAANQFLLYRFLYGTERATTDDPRQPIIPPMVPNRTNGLARWARWLSLIGLVLAALSMLFVFVDPAAYLPRILAEMGGSLAVMAVGFGLGAAFSPTDLRPAALQGVVLGLLAYALAAFTLLGLPR